MRGFLDLYKKIFLKQCSEAVLPLAGRSSPNSVGEPPMYEVVCCYRLRLMESQGMRQRGLVS
jgi:hypothetical protein